MSLKMRAQSHVGITVRDLDASVRFYHEVLGLEICTEPSPWFDDPGLGQGVGVPGAALRQVCLKLGDTMLELLEYRTPPSETERPLLSHCRGATHVAFQVDDIDPVSGDLLIQQTGALEEYHWFVRSHLEDYAGGLSTTGATTELSAATAALRRSGRTGAPQPTPKASSRRSRAN